jgi:hypothetical protein
MHTNNVLAFPLLLARLLYEYMHLNKDRQKRSDEAKRGAGLNDTT